MTSATEADPVSPDIEVLRQYEAALSVELGLPTSAWTMLTAIAGSGLAAGAGGLPSEPGRLREAIQRLLAEAPGRPGDAIDGTSLRYRPKAKVARDYWTADDALGYAAYSDALAQVILHPETKPPLTIGIRAPWGAGKTSLMRMVQERLDPRLDRETWQPDPIRLEPGSRRRIERTGSEDDGGPPMAEHGPGGRDETPGVGARVLDRLRSGAGVRPVRAHVTNADVVKASSGLSGSADALVDELNVQSEDRWRPTVWFNPWMYQNGEQIWAGLAHEIIRQVSDRLEPHDREWFWLQLNLRRLDRVAVRRRIYGTLLTRLVPGAIIAAGILLLAGGFALASLLLPALGALLRGGAGLLFLGGGGLLPAYAWLVQRRLWREPTAVSFGDLVRAPDLGRELGNVLAERGADLIADPRYEARLGFLHLVQTDMKRVLDLVATPERPLVVFVDDLDRCSPGSVVQVIEAINLFLAGEFPNCIFVIALEPEVVVAHIESANEKLVHRLAASETALGWSTLGWRFLEKIVQLPVSLPGIPEYRDDYVASLVADAGNAGTPLPRVPVAPLAARNPAQGDGPREDARDRVPDTPAETVEEAVPREREAVPPPGAAPVALDEAQVARLAQFIRERQPALSMASVLQAAREVDRDLRPPTAPDRLAPETVEAAQRVLSELLSEQHSEVRAAIADGAELLGSHNPRQIKRFLNLFRFYALVGTTRALRGDVDVASLPSTPQLVKAAAVAVRWPDLTAPLIREVAGEAGRSAVEVIEELLRAGPQHGGPPDGEEDEATAHRRESAWRAANLDGEARNSLRADLLRLLREDPAIGAVVRLLY